MSSLKAPILVAVAIIEDKRGRILLSRRHEGTHQGGLWEFPGGKVKPGETVPDALVREIREELGVEITAHQPLIQIPHNYPDKSVLLDVYRVIAFNGEPEGREGQQLEWVLTNALGEYPMPAADGPIVTALRLPSTYLITGPNPNEPDRFLKRLEQALIQGQRLIQLRAVELSEPAFLKLAASVLPLAKEYSARLLVNTTPEIALSLNADGVHLNSHRLMALSKRPLPKDRWVAASCHSPQELQKAMALDSDFAVLSPVLHTSSHPHAAPIGWDGFAKIVETARLPVYALGGMMPEMITEAQQRGGQGIAAITGLWPISP